MAANALEAFNEGKAEEPACTSLHPTHTSNKNRKSNKNEREDASTEFLHVADNAVGCSGVDSSSKDVSNKKIKFSRDSDLQSTEIVHEARKRPRTAVRDNQECSRRKKRKQSKRYGSYSVIIEWLNYYCLSESDEDEVPLINKRTERRRRRQRLHEMSLARESSDVEFGMSTSHTVGSCSLAPKDNSKLDIAPASQPEERSWSSHPVASNAVAGNQAGHESMSSPMHSQIRVEIVEISDG